MIVYKNCRQVGLDKIYECFKLGFSDYIIKLDIPKEKFADHFWLRRE